MENVEHFVITHCMEICTKLCILFYNFILEKVNEELYHTIKAMALTVKVKNQ